MEIALLLHLYQPATQTEEVFRRVYSNSYLPLLRKISKTKDLKISLDLPLSLLEQIDRYGYISWIQDLQELIKIGKVEIAGTAAYHPILSKFPRNIIEQQVILNEYGLGYYLGEHHSLEGDEAVLIKNIVGFFPPELSVNERVLSVLDSLGYRWMIVDEASIPFDLNYPNRSGIYQYKEYRTKIVCRNRSFSNFLSFKRDVNDDDLRDSLNFFRANEKSFAVVLDGEFFGHHYSEGFIVLDRFLENVSKMGIELVTMSEYVADNHCDLLKDFAEASWGASDEDMANGNLYPMWDAQGNKIHSLQWQIMGVLIDAYNSLPDSIDTAEYAVLPIWKSEGIAQIDNPLIKSKVAREILLQKAIHSDQFWWASKKIMPASEYLYSPDMIERGLKIIEEFTGMLNDTKVTKEVEKRAFKIRDLLSTEN